MKAEQSKENPKSKETDEQRVERLAQEKFQKLLEERGLLKTYTSLPSSSGIFSREQIAAMSPEEYAKNREAIQKAYDADKIK